MTLRLALRMPCALALMHLVDKQMTILWHLVFLLIVVFQLQVSLSFALLREHGIEVHCDDAPLVYLFVVYRLLLFIFENNESCGIETFRN